VWTSCDLCELAGLGQLVRAVVWRGRRLWRWDTASAPPRPTIESAMPPAAPIPASAQSNPPVLAVTRTILGDALTGPLGLIVWCACALAVVTGTYEPFALRSKGLAPAGAARAASASASATPLLMRWAVVRATVSFALSIAVCDRVGENHQLWWSKGGQSRSTIGLRACEPRASRGDPAAVALISRRRR
jgi:hypothetical protein